jgi:hypothetical protein
VTCQIYFSALQVVAEEFAKVDLAAGLAANAVHSRAVVLAKKLLKVC